MYLQGQKYTIYYEWKNKKGGTWYNSNPIYIVTPKDSASAIRLAERILRMNYHNIVEARVINITRDGHATYVDPDVDFWYNEQEEDEDENSNSV